MTLLRRPVARNLKKNSASEEQETSGASMECSKSRDGTENTEKLTAPTGRNCNPTPVDNEGKDVDEDDDDISAGPDPFPYRPPRQARINQLIKFYRDFIDSDEAKTGKEFTLEDFLLSTNPFQVQHQDVTNYRENDREISSKNYMMSYQTRDYQSGKNKSDEITETLGQVQLNTVDLNKLVKIDLIPRHIPIFQKRLNQIHENNINNKNIKEEIIKRHYEKENKISRMSTRTTGTTGSAPPAPPEAILNDAKHDGLEIPTELANPSHPEHESISSSNKKHPKPLPPLTPKHNSGNNRKVTIANTNTREETRLENNSEARFSATPIQPNSPPDGIKQTNYPITALELAIFDSLAESGGLTLSLRGWFLPSLPILQVLDYTRLRYMYVNLFI